MGVVADEERTRRARNLVTLSLSGTVSFLGPIARVTERLGTRYFP